ncbi:MAG: ATP-dependent DNA helicase RecG [Enterococcus sp.]|nr:ATP-dependent DNA helicase RecG [Enterococcus sp.]
MITVTLSPDNSIAYISPCKRNGLFYSELESLGGFYESRSHEMVSIPLSTSAALGLRGALTGKDISLNAQDAGMLAKYADAPDPVKAPAVFRNHRNNGVIIDTRSMPLKTYSRWRAFWNNNVDYINEIEDGIFTLPFPLITALVDEFPYLKLARSLETSDIKEIMVRKAEAQKTALVEATPEFEFGPIQLPKLAPFAYYDRSLHSLRNTPLASYDYIKADTEKVSAANAKISKANANVPPKGKKKPLQRSLLQKLTSMNLSTAFDMIHYFPLRHIDRSNPKLIKNLKAGEESTVVCTIVEAKADYQNNRATFTVQDAAGSRMRLMMFNQTWMVHNYHKGDEVIVYGKFSPYKGAPSFSSPRMDKVGDTRGSLPMIPVYSQSEKQSVTTWDILALIKETLGRLGNLELDEPLSPEILKAYNLPSRNDAYLNIHLPSSPEAFENANRRLIYEELLRLQLFIQKQKNDITARKGIVQNASVTPSLDSWLTGLPYELTNAQKRAVEAIKVNMSEPSPMHRLVQGDVGAGKSAVASYTVFLTVDNGHQAALLAPTEILAEQLHNGVMNDAMNLISPRTGMPMDVRFLGGKTKASVARKIREGLADGTVDIVVGTHAILSDSTQFADLGTIVVDEQHRFGVEQRTKLRDSRPDGLTPDMLVMTATPIPRSSAMVLYGDLDITVLDELPPGRTPIETFWIQTEAVDAIRMPYLEPWDDIKQQVKEGHQAYIVASLVEDNDKLAAQSVEDAYTTLSEGIFKGYRLGMVHGKQKRAERESVMSLFAAGEIDILVSTTVIEVGVNVPNATIMVVLDPGRFGISQLHQIRGRVGRSQLASRCYLVGSANTDDGEFRLNALVESTDGFYLSEKDLELRKEGTLFSTKQSGQSDLFLAKINEHLHILEVAKKDAQQILNVDPDLSTPRGALYASEIEDFFAGRDIKS